ncbi:MAG: hypothetical protein NTW14_13085 [bacterium]|nr:hypothetical protein [bacterium]
MEKLAVSETLKKIAVGEINLDEITEALRSSELVIKNYRQEVEGLRRSEEQLQTDVTNESSAVDDLTKRLVTLHDEVSLAKSVFRSEIEGRRQILGIKAVPLDLEALDLAGLIRERENVQKLIGKVLGSGQLTLQAR